jgi:methylmalonyl-CoA/ethylmalonyl-CoA epimerase
VIRDIDLDHVAIACERLGDAWPRYARDLGGRWLAGGATAGFANGQVTYRNGMKVELLEPNDVEANDFLRRFLDRNGPGPHHLTYKVADIRAALAEAEDAGYPPINVFLDDPGWQEGFLHPKIAHGIVIQIAHSEGEGWDSPPPPGFPEPATERPADLLRVVHAVASLDGALQLFEGLLQGRRTGEGRDADGPWVELAWPGPGRVRLVEATGGPLEPWLAGATGRVHRLDVAVDDPSAIPGAVPAGDAYEIPPDGLTGTRIRLVEG